MRFLRPVIAGVAGATIVSSNADAQISYVSQERTLAAHAQAFNIDGTSVEDGASGSAPDFTPYNEIFTADAVSAEGASSTVTVSYLSELLPDSIFAQLDFGAVAGTGFTGAPAQGDAQIGFLCLFDLAHAANIELNAYGNMSLFGRVLGGEPSDLFGSVRMRLSDATTDETIAEITLTQDDDEADLRFQDNLPAGHYALMANLQTSLFVGEGAADFASTDGALVFQLTVAPSPAGAPCLLVGGAFLARRRRRRPLRSGELIP